MKITSETTINDSSKVFGTMQIIHKGNGLTNYINDTPNEYSGYIGVEFNPLTNNWVDGKPSYSIELRSAINEDISAPILGMGSEEDWELHGPYSDKTLIRNYLAFYLWQKTRYYGSGIQLCEVVVNEDYKGVYIFMEKIKRDASRIDIAKLNIDENTGDDLTGGYIFKIDKVKSDPDVKSWLSQYPPNDRIDASQVINFQIVYPKEEEITATQFQYISDYVKTFETVLKGANFTNSVGGYGNYANKYSFINYSLLVELTKNVDGYRRDAHLYKDKDSNGGKLIMGPPLNFQFTLGNNNDCEATLYSGWVWDQNSLCSDKTSLNPFWWERFLEDQSYLYALKKRWQSLRSDEFSTESILNVIDSLATVLNGPYQRNFARWPVMGNAVWPNTYVGTTYEEEISYLKTWITYRMEWMDQEFDATEIVLSNSTSQQKVTVYPNPVENILNIFTTQELNNYLLLDYSGKIISKGNFQSIPLPIIDISNIKSGYYVLSLFTKEGDVITTPVIKK
ncbi:CotH kinase family protein [Marinoscillum sp. MHG1-6]|uniref:CotH kinase family protein n=1 Tax=Marinoscillum sp. MHG1-6 TaxID=2959627 RepID=UPI0021576EE1|nr:CotH kinase family protein [Marinoscillum sp. MHG1-6]